ncbi:MAG: hypothetical protein Q6K80_07750 [Thermostichus sp. DG_1_6_bins_120]
MAIIAFLYAAALVLLLTGLVVWAASKQLPPDAPDSGVPDGGPMGESSEALPASILEQLERQYRNSPSYNPDPTDSSH